MAGGSTVFISYAHEDQKLLEELVNHLKPLEEEGLISSWSDRKILPGSGWEAQIDENLKKADLVLLLVSSDFINSDYAYGKEMNVALARSAAGLCTTVPVILRPVAWENTVLGLLNALPTGGKAITSKHWKSQDAAFKHVTEELRKLLKTKPKDSAAPAQTGNETENSPKDLLPSPPQPPRRLWPIITSVLIGAILALSTWVTVLRLDASHSDQFLYKTLARSLKLAFESDRFSELSKLANDAGEFYEGLHLGQNKKQRIQALALHYQGIVLDNRDELAKAEEKLLQSVEKRRQLLELDSDNLSLKSDLVESLVALAAVKQHAGNFAAAQKHLEDAERLIAEVVNSDATNSEFGRRKFLTEFRLGRISELRAESPEGSTNKDTLLISSKKHYSDSRDTCSKYRELAETSPEEKRAWDSLCAFAWSRLGRLEKEPQKAIELFEKALEIRRALLQDDESNTEYQLNVAESEADLARLHAENQEPEVALELALSAAKAVKKGHDDEPNSVRNLIWYCELVTLNGQIYRQLDRMEEATGAFQQVVDRLEVLVNSSLSESTDASHSKDLFIVYSDAALELEHRPSLLKSALKILREQNSAPKSLMDKAKRADLW